MPDASKTIMSNESDPSNGTAMLTDTNSFSPTMANALRAREVQLLLLVLLVAAIIASLTPNFVTESNLKSVAMGMTYDLIVALGMTYALILGGIDLSVGSNVALSGIVATLLLQMGVVNVPVAICIGLAVGISIGAINGYVITRFRINSFVVTLGMMSLARGAAMVLTSGYFVTSLPESFLLIGRGEIMGIPFPVIASVLIVLAFHFLLNNWLPLSRGFHVGANPDYAELLGISVKKTVLAGYALCGLFCGITAMVMCSRLGMGYAQFGLEMELKALGAAVIGGATFSGGRGSIIGTFLGVLLLALINNGFVLMDASIYWQKVVNGTIVIIAIATAARHAKLRG
ncbi:MAG: ABC transporter permease [Rhodospirillales bacterium]|nr:ABC transporter permease [Rhodospirillales bacterium]